MAELVFKRERSTVNRDIRRAIAATTAAEAIGEIAPGCEIFGLSKGQFSLVDIMRHCLATSGPADVLVSTWTAANADLGFAYELMTNGAIRSMRFVVDFSFPTRQPEYAAALRERFGDDSIRVTKTHAKFVVIRNEQWSLVIRSSMNLNENRRLESFEVSDCPRMADWLEQVVDDLFDCQKVTEGFTNKPYDNCLQFEGFLETGSAAVLSGKSTDEKKYFGDGKYSTDLRRAGVTRG
jgi:hypothetical protein